jgi:hypothetical protein
MQGGSNPIATEEQHEVERRALELRKHPVVAQAWKEVREHWLAKAAPSAEMRACFDAAFEEVMNCATVWSLNQDPQRPKVVTITRLRHRIGDLEVPGSRYGLDNPDSVYRIIPIDGSERYRIHGRVAKRRLSENYFNLWDANMNTVAVFSGHDLEVGADGSFSIDVDSDPAGGRRNHIRSTAKAHEFYIRDVILHWAEDRASELRVEKLGPPKTPPRSEDEQAELAARFMRAYADNTVRWNDQALGKPANSFQFKIDRETDGALGNQIYILGHFRLRDGEALVLDVDLGGAAYFIAPITNLWGTTNEIAQRTGSLNKAQSVANPDGTLRYVVSVEDPGVHNWVDPCGMHEGILTLRWAEFPSGRPGPELGAKSRVVPVASLRGALPAGTRFVTPEERRRQQEERGRAYAWRLLDR